MKNGSYLLLLDDSKDDRVILDYAKTIIGDNQGNLHVLWPSYNPQTSLAFIGHALSGGVADRLIEEATAHNKETAENITDRVKRWVDENNLSLSVNEIVNPSKEAPITVTLSLSEGLPIETIAKTGKVSDFIFLPLAKWSYSEERQDRVHAAIFETGHPVFLLPRDMEVKKPKKIAIAWNGKLEVAHTVTSAMPLLKNAEEVLIYVAPSARTPQEITEGLGRWLRLHDINASKIILERGKHPVGKVMLEQADKDDIDLLIMGAWTRDKFKQFILGGMTNYVLQHASIPILMGR